MKRIVIATVVGGLVLFMWNAVSWMVLGLHDDAMSGFGDEAAVLPMLKSAAPEAGAYFFPAPPDTMDPASDAWKAFEAQHEAGPVGLMFIHPDGRSVMPPSTFVIGFVTCVLGALIAAVLLWFAAPQLPGYVGRAVFVASLGVLIALMADLTYMNWLYFTMEHTIVMVIDQLAGWILAGLAMAAIIKSKAASAAA